MASSFSGQSTCERLVGYLAESPDGPFSGNENFTSFRTKVGLGMDAKIIPMKRF
jgi:hypothetical protein